MASRLLILVAWPAFLAACVLEVLVFAVVDPHDLHWFGLPFAPSRQAVYSGAFLIFWLVAIGASALTALLARPGNGDSSGTRAD
ncbi:MAG TPA: hypothetical protein VLJ57_07595 [Burkholderiaceae bacterium]|nr:hypothetical protein [Burkholderiaceae bacterium]